MPLLSGVAGGLVAAGNFLRPTETDFDPAHVVSETFFGVRHNTVEQKFERTLAAIEFKLKKQELHREDIRDLVELTTTRTDIYHLVGTLLLAFCMDWYIEPNAWQLPVWFSDLWLISNFSAVGYLLMCVWLAMYAAIAARSIGTRLLTSYARLSFPTKEHLDDIKVPIFFPNIRDQIKKKFRRSNSNPDLSANTQSSYRIEDGSFAPLPAEVHCEDDQQHFRVFLEELPRWLVHDTWARVCMSFGMNQMLQALSYFSLGVMWTKSPMTGIMSFIAINLLSTIILWLDIGDKNHTWDEYAAVMILNFMPPILATVLLLYESIWPRIDEGPRVFASVMVLVCFVFHAMWLWYLVSLFHEAGSPHGRFQPGTFVNVLERIETKAKGGPQKSSKGARKKAPLALVEANPDDDKLISPALAGNEGPDGPRPQTKRGIPSARFGAATDMAERLAEEAIAGGFGQYHQAIMPGDRVVVMAAFRSDDEDGVELKKGQNGVVQEINIDGDAYIDFQGTDRITTVFKPNFGKLDVVVQINGGRTPGTWMKPTRPKDIGLDHQMSQMTKGLPVRMIRYFTITTIVWWLVSGIIHCLMIVGDEHNQLEHFTGSDDMPKPPHLALLQFPEPSRLFKVSALYCSDSQVWVSDSFSVYSVGQNITSVPGSLGFVRDGNVAAVICGRRKGCDALSPPEGEGPWTLQPLDSALHHTADQVPIPHSWRLVAGAWKDCPVFANTSCTAASLVAWDGGKIYAANMYHVASTKTWKIHTRFEVDPVVGFCTGQHQKCEQEEAKRYSNVRSLQLSADGRALIVLLDRGVTDVWDLSKGIVLKTLHLGDRYTSLCRSGQNLFLAREGAAGPVIATATVSAGIMRLLDPQGPKQLQPPNLTLHKQSLPNASLRSLRDKPTLHFESLPTIPTIGPEHPALDSLQHQSFLARKRRISRSSSTHGSAK